MNLFRKRKIPDDEKYEEELDDITGLLTIVSFRKHYKETLEKKPELKVHGAIIYFNISKFADFNDKYGYEAGDKLLREFARELENVFPDCLLTRFASDHFYTLTVLEGAEDKIMQMQSALMRLRRQSALQLQAGVYVISGKDDVSRACDRAKMAGDAVHPGDRQCYRIYDESMNANLQKYRYIVEHLDEALEKGWIKVYFQPVVRTLTGQLCGVEALARWQDPVYHLMPPGDFIEVLERERLIWKLDTYVLKESCRMVHEKLKKGETPVPFSFNVSRLDFNSCDIFGILNKNADAYQIPKEYINIEITERMLMDNASVIQSRIHRFHADGYQVWMDDFGSEFSSLNILKDVDFDEIKIDMGFLRDFSERSRQIIISVVDMAKRLGIQTLAEGVETKEQLDFLKNIGCEKIQGYYYDRPEPLEEMERTLETKNITIESPSLRQYYDKTGKVNLLNGTIVSRGENFKDSMQVEDRASMPLCLVEFYHNQFHFLFANQSWLDVLQSMGFSGPKEAENVMNLSTLPAAKVFRQYALQLKETGTEQRLNYVINENYCFFKAKMAAETDDRVMIELSMANLSEDAELHRAEKMDDRLRTLYSMYEEIFVATPAQDAIEHVFDESGRSYDTGITLHEVLEQNEMTTIYPGDRQRYRNFVEPSTMIQRIKTSGEPFISDYFRTRERDGSFVWKTHISILVQDKLQNKVLVCIRTAFPDDTQWEALVAAILESAAESRDTDKVKKLESLLHLKNTHSEELRADDYWKNIVMGSDLIGFWKDRNRRFLGVTQAFLNLYGLQNPDEIIGKTDEEMGWHVDPEPFQTDEEKLLQDGTHIVNQHGQCIIKGQQRELIVSKFPLYKNGKIVGLIGYALDAEKLFEEGFTKVFETDELTGLSNVRGLLIAAEHYINSWLADRKDFVLVDIHLSCMKTLWNLYGRKAADLMLKQIGEELKRELGSETVLARTAGDQFICLKQIEGEKEIYSLIEHILSVLNGVHEVNGQHFNTYQRIGWADMAECTGIENMYQRAEYMAQSEKKEEYSVVSEGKENE